MMANTQQGHLIYEPTEYEEAIKSVQKWNEALKFA